VSTWKISAGTASVFGWKHCNADVFPATAYVMVGEKCTNECQFCTQSSKSQSRPDRLSRIAWTEYDSAETAQAISDAYKQNKVGRVCLQVVHSDGSQNDTLDAIQLVRSSSEIPISVSSHLESITQAREVFQRGVNRLCIALDAATPDLYNQIKGGDWQKKWQLLNDCITRFPGMVITHLIVGLGETEEQMIHRLASCQKLGIETALFAFTPAKGTMMERKLPPEIGHYRRVQIAAYLLKSGYSEATFSYSNGRLTAVDIPLVAVVKALGHGDAFRVSGCPDCNRPYYNESPGKVMYNYPRPLTRAETRQALIDCCLWEMKNNELAVDYQRNGQCG